MSESSTHADLVQAVIAFARGELGAVADIAVRDDSVRPLRGERPPRIGGYVPDVLATTVPTTATLIGEAKTRSDLETERSARQISAFLRYLADTPNGIFVLAVPLAAMATARRIVQQGQSTLGGKSVRSFVIDGSQARL